MSELPDVLERLRHLVKTNAVYGMTLNRNEAALLVDHIETLESAYTLGKNQRMTLVDQLHDALTAMEELRKKIAPDFHVIEFASKNWVLRHPMECSADELSCPLFHLLLELEEVVAPDGDGSYRVEEQSGTLALTKLADEPD